MHPIWFQHLPRFFFFTPLVSTPGSDGHQGSVCGPLQRVRGERRLLLGGRQRPAGRRGAAAGGRHEANPGARSQPGARHLGLRFRLPPLRLRPAHTRQRLPLAGQGRLWNAKVMDVLSRPLSFGICKTLCFGTSLSISLHHPQPCDFSLFYGHLL